MTAIAPGLAPFASQVLFSGPGLSTPFPGPNDLIILQEEYKHDTVALTYWGGDVDSDSLLSGTPMAMSWGRQTVKRALYGYVNHASRVNNALSTTNSVVERNAIKVACVGASWPMKQADTRVWTNYTAAQVVTEIAALFGLDVDAVDDGMTWPSLQMEGKSYWQFCVSLAKRIGYTFYCNGVQLVFKPRRVSASNLLGVAAIYDYRTDPSGFPVFSPILGATSPQGGQLKNRVLAGIDPRTNQIVTSFVSGDPSPSSLGVKQLLPVFTEIETCAVDTQAEANAKTNGLGQQNQLFITATATATGNPYVSQGSLVSVQNANGGQNGLWFVVSAKHVLTTKNYTLYLTLGRNGLGASPAGSLATNINTPPNAVLSGSSWVAVG